MLIYFSPLLLPLLPPLARKEEIQPCDSSTFLRWRKKEQHLHAKYRSPDEEPACVQCCRCCCFGTRLHLLYYVMLRAYSHAVRASPPSHRNAAMRLPQPRLGQCTSASSNSRRSVPIATANEDCGSWIIIFFFLRYCCDCMKREYFKG